MGGPGFEPELVLRGGRLGAGGPLVDIVVGSATVLQICPVGLAASRAAVVDLDGSTVLPGLWDGHIHSRQWALRRHGLDLAGVGSAPAAADLIATWRPDEPVVTAFQADLARWSAAHKDLLAGENRPVLVQSRDLHSAWLNDAALALAGRAGHATGVLHEADCFAAVAELCARPELRADDWVLESMRTAATRGVVGVVDFEMADNLADWTRRAAAGPLPVRVECSVPRHLAEQAVAAGRRTDQQVADRVSVGPVKLFLDGSLTSGTALLDPDNAPLIPPSELDATVRRLAEQGLRCAVHAIGDQAVTLALDAFAGAQAPGRIEHAELVAPEQLARFGTHGVVASVQPAHLHDDRDLALWSARGTEGAFAYAALLHAGATLELGSDAPVMPLDPWVTLAAAVHRATPDRASWVPDQRLSFDQALTASTRGRRAPRVGDAADLMIVRTDFGTAAIDEGLATTRVHATMLAGGWTHGG